MNEADRTIQFILPRKLSGTEIVAEAYKLLSQFSMQQSADCLGFPRLIEGELTPPPHKETET